MVGNQVGWHFQEIPQLTIALHPFHQEIEDQQALRLSQYFQTIGQGFQIDWGEGVGGLINSSTYIELYSRGSMVQGRMSSDKQGRSDPNLRLVYSDRSAAYVG